MFVCLLIYLLERQRVGERTYTHIQGYTRGLYSLVHSWNMQEPGTPSTCRVWTAGTEVPGSPSVSGIESEDRNPSQVHPYERHLLGHSAPHQLYFFLNF